MTLHALSEWVKYRWRAKGRHGVHSPFVYDFVDKGLHRKGIPDHTPVNLSLAAPLPEGALFTRICRHFGIRTIMAADAVKEPLQCYELYEQEGRLFPDPDERITGAVQEYLQGIKPSLHFSIDLLYLRPAAGAHLLSLWEKYQRLISPGTIVMIDRIHATREHTAAWDGIRSPEKVRLSMDLFHTGLLFFREEFLVQQHFVLKCW